MKFYAPAAFMVILALLRFSLTCLRSGNLCQTEPNPPEIVFLTKIRSSSVDLVDRNFPSPHSELLLGMLIGLDRLGEVPGFSDALKNTGTIHVVVVSGFNIALVFGLITKLLGSEYKLSNLVIAQVFTLLYSLLSGFEPPVVRALVMGSVVAWGKYYGRVIDGFRVLIFAASIMVLIDPWYFTSVSFQLSFAASMGLILFSKTFSNVKIPEDLKSTMSAQLLVWPIISFYFGKISPLGIIVNPLVLWTVSISTVLGGIFVILGFISPFLGTVFSVILYPFLDIFFRVVMWFGVFSAFSLNVKITLWFLVAYYFLLFGVLYVHNRFRRLQK